MKLIIVGSKMKKIVEFNDVPMALKIINDSGKTIFYHFKDKKVIRVWNTKAKKLIDALIRRE